MAHRELTDYRRIDEIFSQALELSPADETELVWLERRHGQVSSRVQTPGFHEPPRCTVQVRVVEKGRVGWHRTEQGELGQIEAAVRQAMALATTEKTARRLPVLPLPGDDIVVPDDLFDHRVAGLDLESARRQAQSLCAGSDEEAILRWSQVQIAVVNSHGLCRQGEATQISLIFRSGDGPLAGRAAGSARSLRDLDAPRIVARARSRRTALPLGELPAGPLPLFLSAEVTTELLNVVNIFALGGRAYLEGSSVLSRHRNVQVFDQNFHLRDDPQARPGLRFPFDFEGSRKKALDLVVGGRPILPALSQHQGGEAGLESTAQSVGGRDSFFGNLFLLPGELDEPALLAQAEGGIYASWIDRPECYEPTQLRIRGILRGVRAVKDGRIAEPLPDLRWEDGLLHAFGRLRGVGHDTVVRAMPSTPFGAIGAPPLVLADAAELQVAGEVAVRSQATVLSPLPPPGASSTAQMTATGLHTTGTEFVHETIVVPEMPSGIVELTSLVGDPLHFTPANATQYFAGLDPSSILTGMVPMPEREAAPQGESQADDSQADDSQADDSPDEPGRDDDSEP